MTCLLETLCFMSGSLAISLACSKPKLQIVKEELKSSSKSRCVRLLAVPPWNPQISFVHFLYAMEQHWPINFFQNVSPYVNLVCRIYSDNVGVIRRVVDFA